MNDNIIKDMDKRQFLDSVINPIANMGTSRDKRSYTGWSGRGIRGLPNAVLGSPLAAQTAFSLSLDRVTLENMYSEDWASAAVIDIPVNDMLRQWRQFTFEGPYAKEMQEEFEDAETRFLVREQIEKALKWGRLYGGAGIFIGIDGQGDPSLPLNDDWIMPNTLRFLKTLDRWHLTPQDINYFDPSKHNYFKPNYYRISGTNMLMHHTRLIRFGGDIMPYYVSTINNLWDNSVLQRIYDALTNAASTPNLVNSQIYEANVPLQKIKNLAQIISSQGGESRLQQSAGILSLFKSIYNTLLFDTEVELEFKSPNLTGLGDFIERFYKIICPAARIPVSKFLGEGVVGLGNSGERDIRNYYDDIKAQQETRISPVLFRLDKIIMLHLWGFIPEGYSWEWNPLWQMSDKEKADTDLVNGQRDEIYMRNDVLTPQVIARNLKNKQTYTDIDEELIEGVSNKFLQQFNPPKSGDISLGSGDSDDSIDSDPFGSL